ncbi:MAG: mechanosensitive ion channel family protein [Oscillospiraceae bacterium]|nr:mechanosensitive ion channel family protein [Oscillospiraceae bacterium]
MEVIIDSLAALATSVGSKIVFAVVVLIIGKLLINAVMKLLKKGKLLDRLDASVKTFALSFVKIALYVLLIISIIGILGVPMASIVAALASAGVAIGLALQGALSNLAGGIMLMAFKPFKVDDFVEASGVSGVVKEITMFYTVIMTLDNKRITVPNGNLMNANIVDYSSEDLRRVDLEFTCARNEDPAKVQSIMIKVMEDNSKVLDAPSAPFARVSGGTNEAMNFVVRAWCTNADYWDVYFDLTQGIIEALGEAGVQAPAVRVMTESK